MQRPEYKGVFAISQSALKTFKTKTLAEFKEKYIDQVDDGDDDKFAFGSLVDTVVFTPNLMEERFYIPSYEVEIPGEKVKQIVDNVYKEALGIVETKVLLNEKGNLPEPLYIPNIQDLYDWQEQVIKHAKAIQYGGTTWSRSRIMDTVGNDGQTYFRLLSEANGRQVITVQDNADAVEMDKILKSDPQTRMYFIPEEGQQVMFQQEIFVDFAFEDMIIPLKGAIDILWFDHDNKTVRVPDLKTTSNLEMFAKIAKEFGYIIQVDFYEYLVHEWLKTYNDGAYADYTFLTPLNIVIDRKLKVPYIYEYDRGDLEIARYGSKEQGVDGWLDTLKKIGWHIKSGKWDKPKELYETGSIKLKIFK